MRRVYKTLGDAALKSKITVTMNQALLDRIKKRAEELDVDKTWLARSLIEQGLDDTNGR